MDTATTQVEAALVYRHTCQACQHQWVNFITNRDQRQCPKCGTRRWRTGDPGKRTKVPTSND